MASTTKTITVLTEVNEKYTKLVELAAQELASTVANWSGGRVGSIENDIIKLLSVIDSDEMKTAIAVRALAVIASNGAGGKSSKYETTKDRSGIFGR